MQCVAQSTPFIGVGLTMLRRRTLVPYLKSKLPVRATRARDAATPSHARHRGAEGCGHEVASAHEGVDRPLVST